MPFNATIMIVVGSAIALALGALLIYMVRRSSYREGVAVTEKKHESALLEAQIEGDQIVAIKRDPHDVSVQLSNGEF